MGMCYVGGGVWGGSIADLVAKAELHLQLGCGCRGVQTASLSSRQSAAVRPGSRGTAPAQGTRGRSRGCSWHGQMGSADHGR
jgi:hypothetical protein